MSRRIDRPGREGLDHRSRGVPETEADAGTAPVTGRERIVTLDVLRGFALLWIFLFNVFLFSGYEFFAEALTSLPTATLDQIALFLRRAFVENKGFSLFSFIFGVGFGISSLRARRDGRSFVPRFLRRQGVLLLLGIAHGVLLWGGDILVIYALLGLVLLPFLRASNRTLVLSALVIYLLPIGLYALSLVRPFPDPYQLAVSWTGEPNLFGIMFQGWPSESYLEVVKANIAFLAFWWSLFIANSYWPDVLGMFLIGYYVGRSRWLERIEADPSVLPGRLVLWAGAFGVSGNLLVAYLLGKETYYTRSVAGLLLTALQYVSVPLLCFFYMAGLAWLYQRARWRPRLRPLADAGRMTLTNYLLQSVVSVFVFYGVGLGLFGKVGATVAILIALVVFALQVAFSRWWWSRGFLFGPAEWLWRMGTYVRALPLRASVR